MLWTRLSNSRFLCRVYAPDETGGADVEAQLSAEPVDERHPDEEQGGDAPAERREGGEPQAGQCASLRLIRGGAETGDVFAFCDSAVIGRFDPSVGPIDVDLGGLDEGSFVSRRHARISFQNGGWVLEDLGSSNGTFVLEGDDFRRIEEPTRIEDGATVAFGTARLLFRTEVGGGTQVAETELDER
ncbi:MAG: hypothetical protein C4341_00730 [Armatimonadota bacterium]